MAASLTRSMGRCIDCLPLRMTLQLKTLFFVPLVQSHVAYFTCSVPALVFSSAREWFFCDADELRIQESLGSSSRILASHVDRCWSTRLHVSGVDSILRILLDCELVCFASIDTYRCTYVSRTVGHAKWILDRF
jgi:hypothetical protein